VPSTAYEKSKQARELQDQISSKPITSNLTRKALVEHEVITSIYLFIF
jgi:hypothetical protein